MWLSRTLESADACSVFSFAMMVRVWIWNLSFTDSSDKESLKSPATSAAGPVLLSDVASLRRGRFARPFAPSASAGRFDSIAVMKSGCVRSWRLSMMKK